MFTTIGEHEISILHSKGARICASCCVWPCLGEPRHEQEVDSVIRMRMRCDVELHQHPELSAHEVLTAARLAKICEHRLRVTEHVGGSGVVAVLENGRGDVMLRTELDAFRWKKRPACVCKQSSSEGRRGADVRSLMRAVMTCTCELVGAAAVLRTSR